MDSQHAGIRNFGIDQARERIEKMIGQPIRPHYFAEVMDANGIPGASGAILFHHYMRLIQYFREIAKACVPLHDVSAEAGRQFGYHVGNDYVLRMSRRAGIPLVGIGAGGKSIQDPDVEKLLDFMVEQLMDGIPGGYWIPQKARRELIRAGIDPPDETMEGLEEKVINRRRVFERTAVEEILAAVSR